MMAQGGGAVKIKRSPHLGGDGFYRHAFAIEFIVLVVEMVHSKILTFLLFIEAISPVKIFLKITERDIRFNCSRHVCCKIIHPIVIKNFFSMRRKWASSFDNL
jgi:hypothetical protein